MPSRWEQVVVDAEDPPRLARWWAEALGYVIVDESPDRVEIRRAPSELPALLFTPVAGPKTAKNRLHIDVRVGKGDGAWERIVAKSAQLVAAGGRVLTTVDGHHIVMADPEGNEFCVAA